MPKKAQAAQAQSSGKVEGTTALGTGDQATSTGQVDNSSTVTNDTGASSSETTGNQGGTDLVNLNQPETLTLESGSPAGGSLSVTSDLAAAGPASSSESSSSDAVAGTGESVGNIFAGLFPSTPGLKVTSKQEGFRRAGRAWSTKPTAIALSELSQEQAEQLLAEPMLVVDIVDLADDDEEF